ncbi:MAG: tRNA (adenosine(37)-N6)-dimethylallyltransferase MiaA [Proteobacteria bacterium]|nr:MAG: tRNA (adenosine(37)-N6)-dimethylallyltransferase MiaA [Pseudomonadota bacterium]
MQARPPVVVVAGPTASGKSAAAIELALRFGGDIVNADSMQVYRYLDVGTAKPSLADRARVPHHLIDVVTPDVLYNAGRYSREARAAASQIHARRGIVFLTGGTGLYIRAFLEGLIEDDADRELRASLERDAARAEREGDAERLHRRLTELDPDAAARIHPNDQRRTVRALELALRHGAPASQIRARHAFADQPYGVLYLVLDPGRDALDRRIDARAQAMIDAGLLQECRALVERGYGPELRPLQAIGYRHVMPVVEGRDTLVNALAGMRRDTRQFARRQRTWFRGVRDAVWVHPDDREGIAARVAAFAATKQAS